MMTVASRRWLQGKKVLVVESEFLLPKGLYRSIETLGAEIIGPVAFANDVLMFVNGNRPDVAIVDARLSTYDREAVFGLFRRMRVPFLQACREAAGRRDDGYLPLPEAQADLTVLGEALLV